MSELKRLSQTELHDISEIIEENYTLDKLLREFAGRFNLRDGNIEAGIFANECEQDVFDMAQALLGFSPYPGLKENVVVPAVDSSSKPGVGILRGNVLWSGLLSECRLISYTPNGTSKHYTMEYNRAFVMTGANCTGSLFSLDLCLPDTCSEHQLNEMFVTGQHICAITQVNAHVAPVDAGTYIVGITVGACFLISILAGLFDFYIHPRLKEHPISSSLLYRCFMAFSIYTNVGEIFDTSNVNKPGQIGPINCIRFWSMVWVIMGHNLNVVVFLSTNPADVFDYVQKTAATFFLNAYYAVDSFLFITGVLLSFMFFKTYKKAPRQTMAPMSWVMFYVHRILRLSPAYYFAILFHTFITVTLLRDAPTLMLPPGYPGDSCRDQFWINLLYINNLVKIENQCFITSWYLALDLQIYLFTPLILIPLALKPMLGFAVAGVIFLLSSASNAFEMFHFYFPPSDLTVGPVQDPRMGSFDDYTRWMYDAPWTRCQIYIMGMLVGYLLQYKQKMHIPWIVNIAMWIISFGLMLSCILTLHTWADGVLWDLGYRTVYSVLSKPAWGVALSWILISCFYGYGGVINAFMSWHIWAPLGRLTYCAYLIHLSLLYYMLSLSQAPSTYTSPFQTVVMTITPSIVYTFLAAIIWSSTFEISFGKVEMLLIGGLRAGRKPVPEQSNGKENGKLEVEWASAPIEKENEESPTLTAFSSSNELVDELAEEGKR